MSTFRQFAGRVRWRWVLPCLAVPITACLMIIGVSQWKSSQDKFKFSRDVLPPAGVLVYVFNGPALLYVFETRVEALVVNEVDLRPLPAVFAFWFLIGWEIEKKLRPTTRAKLYMAVWYAVIAAVCGWLLFSLLSDIHSQLRDVPVSTYLSSIREYGFWTPYLDLHITAIWLILGLLYFGRMLWISVRGVFSKRPTTNGIAHDQILTTND